MQVIIRKGKTTVSFDVSKIVAAIEKANAEVDSIDKEIERIYALKLTEEEVIRLIDLREARRKQLIRYARKLRTDLNQTFRIVWLGRNRRAGRSRTSAVSDLMLLTIPTPPTAEAANRSLRQRGMACERRAA